MYIISGNDIERLIDRLYFTVDIIVVTNRASIHLNSGEVTKIKVEKKMMQ